MIWFDRLMYSRRHDIDENALLLHHPGNNQNLGSQNPFGVVVVGSNPSAYGGYVAPPSPHVGYEPFKPAATTSRPAVVIATPITATPAYAYGSVPYVQLQEPTSTSKRDSGSAYPSSSGW
jgi:hypothetical protein